MNTLPQLIEQVFNHCHCCSSSRNLKIENLRAHAETRMKHRDIRNAGQSILPRTKCYRQQFNLHVHEVLVRVRPFGNEFVRDPFQKCDRDLMALKYLKHMCSFHSVREERGCNKFSKKKNVEAEYKPCSRSTAVSRQ